MLITNGNLDAIFQSYQLAFQQGVQRNFEPAIDFMTTIFPSSTTANFYAWMDAVQGFREWVDERIFNNVMGQKFVVPNRDFEFSQAIGRSQLLDDTYGIFAPMIRMGGESWTERKRILQTDVLIKNPMTYTGTEFFGTHTLKTGVTLTNKTTNALTAATFEAALLAMSAWTFANGELIRPRVTHLVVGEKLRSVAHKIVVNENIATTIQNVAGTENVGGASEGNPNKGKAQLVVLPELAGTADDYWFLLCCGGSIKPIALQVREEAVPKMDTDAFRVERNGRAEFIATGRAAAAPTFPWLAYGGIL